jgi:peptide-methionine (R)-S-oxide reductase
MEVSRRSLLTAAAGAVAFTVGCSTGESKAATKYAFTLTDAEWRKRLSKPAYDTLRHAATEYAGTSPLLKEHRKGVFSCAGCALPLYSSSTKFESGTGWPSFWAPLKKSVITRIDRDGERIEVLCRRCGGHLGHVFDDGPPPTGKRYCMNGVAMTFKPGA